MDKAKIREALESVQPYFPALDEMESGTHRGLFVADMESIQIALASLDESDAKEGQEARIIAAVRPLVEAFEAHGRDRYKGSDARMVSIEDQNQILFNGLTMGDFRHLADAFASQSTAPAPEPEGEEKKLADLVNRIRTFNPNAYQPYWHDVLGKVTPDDYWATVEECITDIKDTFATRLSSASPKQVPMVMLREIIDKYDADECEEVEKAAIESLIKLFTSYGFTVVNGKTD